MRHQIDDEGGRNAHTPDADLPDHIVLIEGDALKARHGLLPPMR